MFYLELKLEKGKEPQLFVKETEVSILAKSILLATGRDEINMILDDAETFGLTYVIRLI